MNTALFKSLFTHDRDTKYIKYVTYLICNTSQVILYFCGECEIDNSQFFTKTYQKLSLVLTDLP